MPPFPGSLIRNPKLAAGLTYRQARLMYQSDHGKHGSEQKQGRPPPARKTQRTGECHIMRKNKKESSGNDLLLHAVTRALPSALTSLTAGFGMGPGVTSSLKSPKDSLIVSMTP
jgi:hypothetical protein